MIDVIIPAYNSHSTIEQTLFSVAYQTIVKNINVYIVDDGSKNNYKNVVNYFSNFMKIKELRLDKNMGPGFARQYGIDNSKGKYIVFIDSDDVFSDCFALENLLNTIKKDDCDIGITDFVEENNHRFISHSNDTIWLHGKIYKRKFLEEKNIKFNNSRANEDNGFNQLAILSGARTEIVNQKTYIWRDNLNSITRSNNYEYKFKGIQGYLDNMLYAIDGALKNNGNTIEISEFSFSVLVASYHYYIQYSEFFKDNNLILEVSKIKHICDKYPISDEKKFDLIESQLNFSLNVETRKYLLNPIITFNQYLELVDERVDCFD